MKAFKSYHSQVIELKPSETKSSEIKVYKDFYLSKIKLKVDSINLEEVLLEIDKYLPITNYKLLLNEEDGTHNYILPFPKYIVSQHLLLNLTNRNPSIDGAVQIFLHGYEENDREIEFEKFTQAKVKTVINDFTIGAGKVNTDITHRFDDDILIDSLTKYFVTGDERNILFNIRNEKNDLYLFREPVNLLFLNNFTDNQLAGLYNPVFYAKKDTVRFFIQNIHPTDDIQFSLALHGREIKR